MVLDESEVVRDDDANLTLRAADTERWLMGSTKNSQRSKVQ